MNNDESVRLSRMELFQERSNAIMENEAKSNAHFREEMRAYIRDQKKLHDIHFQTREKVLVMEARAQGAWWMAAKVGVIASAISGALTWVISLVLKGNS